MNKKYEKKEVGNPLKTVRFSGIGKGWGGVG